MNADTFKKLAEIVSERGYIIDFDTKKHMIEICAEFDDEGQINFDDDLHWTVFVGDKCYTDGEITRAILRKADYIEESHAEGWSFYLGRNCSEDVLADAFEATLGWALNCAAECGELTDAKLDEIEAAGVELEFASRNREWNAEEVAKSDDVSDETKSIIREVCALAREANNGNAEAMKELDEIEDALHELEDAEQSDDDAEPVVEIEDCENNSEISENNSEISENNSEISENNSIRATEDGVIEIEDCEMNPRRTKREVLDNFQKWGGSLKIWNGSAWTFGDDADWKHAKFIQLIDADGGGEHWRSPTLSGEDYARFTFMMAAEMQRKRQTVTLP